MVTEVAEKAANTPVLSVAEVPQVMVVDTALWVEETILYWMLLRELGLGAVRVYPEPAVHAPGCVVALPTA